MKLGLRPFRCRILLWWNFVLNFYFFRSFFLRDLCFPFGGFRRNTGANKTRRRKKNPNVKIGTYSPPYKPQFSAEESQLMCQKVNTAQPDVLFVGMTAPKQEKWVHQYKKQLNAKVICSIGAVFDFYAGTVKHPSEFWIKSGLEWLPRFLKEPRRLAERNLVSTPRFVWEVLRERVKQ